jgi:hypothetical protein
MVRVLVFHQRKQQVEMVWVLVSHPKKALAFPMWVAVMEMKWNLESDRLFASTSPQKAVESGDSHH